MGGHAVEGGEVGQGGDGHGPVGAFVGAEDDGGPAVPGALMDLLQGQAVLPADGAEPGAERDGVFAGHLSWFPLW